MAPPDHPVHLCRSLAADEELAVVRSLEADSALGIRTSLRYTDWERGRGTPALGFHDVLDG